nr:MAG TPA: hypothetical protein [Caudoviricetes sp.]
MQFLDAIGLASFWEKIKNWVNINYLSLTGGTIRGSVSFFNEADGGKSIRIDPSNITNSRYGVNYLFASGKMIPIGEANGVAGLDSNGCVPLDQLGNLDTTVAEVVTALPTTNIKKHIYLIKDASGVTQNQYEEYIYTGDTSAAYDASKWEKLGDFRATVDLNDYSKKNETISNITWENRGSDLALSITTANGIKSSEFIPVADSSKTGVMSNTDKVKLDGIEARANNYSLPLATTAMRGGIQLGYAANGRNYPVQLSGEKAYVNVPWTDTNTTYDLSPYAKTADVNAALAKKVDVVSGKGLSTEDFTAALKTKLNGIATGATADSAIPISVIDALN